MSSFGSPELSSSGWSFAVAANPALRALSSPTIELRSFRLSHIMDVDLFARSSRNLEVIDAFRD